MRISSLAVAFAALPALGAPVSAAQGDQRAPLSADELLNPYFASLARTVEMPQAGPTPELPAETVLNRIAFGSCYDQTRSPAIWQTLASSKPQAVLLMGDNVYGDTFWDGGADLGSLRKAYARLAATEGFAALRHDVPMLTTWDDHDYGLRDGGGNFAFRRFSERIFETFWHSPEDARARDGVYFSRIYGPAGKRVQIIMLDTRFFRSDWRLPKPGEAGPQRGNYLPNTDPSATMLGDTQWAWLEQELARPADMRLVVSSIQVLSEAHNWESWAMMPHERAKLLKMLRERAGGGLAILSGDRHAGGNYVLRGQGEREPIFEITSSSLNKPVASTAKMSMDEPDTKRTSPLIGEPNFGIVEIDWASRAFSLVLKDETGKIRDQRRRAF